MASHVGTLLVVGQPAVVGVQEDRDVLLVGEADALIGMLIDMALGLDGDGRGQAIAQLWRRVGLREAVHHLAQDGRLLLVVEGAVLEDARRHAIRDLEQALVLVGILGDAEDGILVAAALLNAHARELELLRVDGD